MLNTAYELVRSSIENKQRFSKPHTRGNNYQYREHDFVVTTCEQPVATYEGQGRANNSPNGC
jgi:hypothetical protein